MRLSLRPAGVLFVIAALFLPHTASASPASEGRFFFARGQQHYRNARYAAAAEDFLLSYEVAPSPGAMYNAALASLRAGRSADAYSFLAAYHRHADADPARRADAEARMAELLATLAIVHVESSPPGATIYVDRDERGAFGTTPRDIVVESGAHTVHLSMDGHIGARVDVVAVPGERANASGDLPQQVGELRVLGTPEGAAVSVLRDGVEVARTTIHASIELPTGQYRLRVIETGFTSPESDALVRADAEERRTLQARPLPPSVGQALISTTVGVVARVSIDGRPRGETPARVQGLTVGDHELELVSPGRIPWRGNVRIEADRTSFVSVDLEEAQ